MIVGWLLIAFFFFGGIAFVAIPETREIYIGQIWIAVSLFLAAIFVLVGRGKGVGSVFSGDRWTGGTGKPAEQPTTGANSAAKDLERLQRLRQKGDLTDAEYQAQRDRIVSGAS